MRKRIVEIFRLRLSIAFMIVAVGFGALPYLIRLAHEERGYIGFGGEYMVPLLAIVLAMSVYSALGELEAKYKLREYAKRADERGWDYGEVPKMR